MIVYNEDSNQEHDNGYLIHIPMENALERALNPSRINLCGGFLIDECSIEWMFLSIILFLRD